MPPRRTRSSATPSESASTSTNATRTDTFADSTSSDETSAPKATRTRKKAVALVEDIRSPTKKTIDYSLESLKCEPLRAHIPIPMMPSVSGGTPFAVIVSGPAGAGKTSTYKKVLPKWFLESAEYINVDDYAEHLLNVFRLSKPHRSDINWTEMFSLNSKILNIGTKCSKEDLETAITAQKNIIIDKPADNWKPTMDLKKRLEDNGYKVFMLVVYASIDTSLQRNASRARELPIPVVINIWVGVRDNLEKYKVAFSDNIGVINNDVDLEERVVPSSSIAIREPYKHAKTYNDPAFDNISDVKTKLAVFFGRPVGSQGGSKRRGKA
jgi:hypothetical protein